MDRSTIRSEARRQAGEPTSGGRWANASYDSAIERAQEDFALRTLCLKTYAECTTSADTPEIDIGEGSLANFIKVAEVWYFDSSTVYSKLTNVTRDTLSMMQDEFRGTDAQPTAYCIEDRVMEFDSEPEADKTIRIYYYKKPSTLSADDSEPDIDANFHNALVNFTCWKFSEAVDDIEKAVYFRALYEEDIQKALRIREPEGEFYPHIVDDTAGVIRDV